MVVIFVARGKWLELYNWPDQIIVPRVQVEERMWDRRGLNFDHVGFALLTLFSMLTIEGWQK